MILARNAPYGVGPSSSPEGNRAGLQAAMNAAQTAGVPVQLPAGVIPVSVRPSGGYAFRIGPGALDLQPDPLGSTIRQVGTAGSVHWQLFNTVGGQGVGGWRFRPGITLDGGGIVAPFVDQNHLVNVLTTQGPVSDLEFDGVTFLDSGSGAVSTGDAFRAVGSVTHRVSDLRFLNCVFLNSGRSGIAPQYGVNSVLIQDCQFHNTSDQHVDWEISNGGVDSTDYTIRRCTFGSVREGNLSISMGGGAANTVLRRVLVEDCVMHGGGVSGTFVDQVTLRRCRIMPPKIAVPQGTVTFFGLATGILVEDCDITHHQEMGAVAAVLSYRYSDVSPTGFTVRGSRIRQAASCSVLELRSTSGVLVEDCDLVYAGSQADTWECLLSRALDSDISDVTFRDNRVTARARLKSLVRTSPDSGRTMGKVDMSGNTWDPAKVQYALQAMGTAAQYLVEPACSGSTSFLDSVATPPPILLGGVRGGERTLSGRGTPEGAVSAPVGSVFLRRETSQRYKKSTGTGPTGWVLD